MAVLRALLIVTVVSAVAVLPCVVGLLIIVIDEGSERVFKATRRWLRRRWGAVRRSRIPRVARVRADAELERATASGPPIEQVAADLRRLSRQRVGIATRSRVWFTAVQRAHDETLRLACRQLDVEEHLQELAGVDLEVERVRVEGVLQARGLVVRDADAQPPCEQR